MLATPAQLEHARQLIATGESQEGVGFLLTKGVAPHSLCGSGLVDCQGVIDSVLLKLKKDPFDAVGVEPTCTSSEAKLKYRKLALRYHPDRNPKTAQLFM